MFIPLGTDRPLRRVTLITYCLIAANIAVFLMQVTLRRSDPAGADHFEMLGSLRPFDSAAQGGPGFHWWGLITYAFFHADLKHLLGNMLFLYVFGPNIEDRLGRVWFIIFYALGAVVAGLAQTYFEKTGVWGASGAIAACTGAYLVMFPRTKIKVIFLLYLGIMQVSAWWFIAFAIVWDIFSHGFGVGDRVARLAHLAGYGYGAAVALVLLWRKLVPREPYDLFTIGKQAYRRRKFKEAGLAAQEKLRRHWDKPGDPEAAALAEARANVTTLISSGKLAEAGKAYKSLADRFANIVGGTTLSRRCQYELGNYFYQHQDSDAAVFAYSRFLEAYPKDPEAANIRLLVGMIHARALNDPIKAKALIGEAMKDLDELHRELAKRELEALG